MLHPQNIAEALSVQHRKTSVRFALLILIKSRTSSHNGIPNGQTELDNQAVLHVLARQCVATAFQSVGQDQTIEVGMATTFAQPECERHSFGGDDMNVAGSTQFINGGCNVQVSPA